MIKTIAFVLFLFITITATAQSNFDIGFKEAFANGYCYSSKNAGWYCNPPIPPFPPLPQITENYNSLQDGYNRGFLFGQAKRRATEAKSESDVPSKSPTRFNPYVPQVPTVSSTPDYTGAAAVAGAVAIGVLLDEMLTSTPEGRARRAEAQRQKEQLRMKHEAERMRIRESNRLVTGSDKYYKCKKSKNIWLGSALLTGAAGTFSYLQANKYAGEYKNATVEAASIAQKADMYYIVAPVCFAVAGFSAFEFIIKSIKIGNAKTNPLGFYPQPIPGGAGLCLTFKF